MRVEREDGFCVGDVFAAQGDGAFGGFENGAGFGNGGAPGEEGLGVGGHYALLVISGRGVLWMLGWYGVASKGVVCSCGETYDGLCSYLCSITAHSDGDGMPRIEFSP